MTKFRAVLTIFGDFKVMEMRFADLNEDITKVSVNMNNDNRHEVDGEKFIKAVFNLTDAMNHYSDSLMAKVVISKMFGLI